MAAPCALELTSARWLEPDGDGMLTIQLEPLSGAVIQFLPQRPQSMELPRAAGVVCHLTAIPGRHGRPTFTDGRDFVDFLARAGQKLWQVLPLDPVGMAASPYVSPAAFAGETSLIDRDRQPDWNGYDAFCRDNAGWLDDCALYMAIREARKGAPWQEWPEDERDRTDLGALKAKYAAAKEGYRRDQYWFWSQWGQHKDYANSQGVRIVGDLPLGVAADSADVWAHRELFQLDSRGWPSRTAGVRESLFSAPSWE